MSAITDWLTSIGACAPGTASMASVVSVSAGYSAISQPDWFLWFCFGQTTDPNEKKRVLGILATMMCPVLTSTVASTDVAACIEAAVSDVTAFLGGVFNPDAARTHLVLLNDVPAASPTLQAAKRCASALIHVCLADPGPRTSTPASDLARQWMNLEQLLGTLPEDNGDAITALTNTLRNAIPLNNMTGLPT